MNKRFFKIILPIFGLFVASSFLASCSSSSNKSYKKLEDFSSCRFGCVEGAAFPVTFQGQDVIKDYTFSEYADYSSLIQSVYNNKIDAFVTDMPLSSAILMQDTEKKLTVFPTPVVDDNYGVVFASGSPLVAEFNSYIASLNEDGVIDELKTKWLTNYALNPVKDSQTVLSSKYNPSYDGSAKTLVFGGTGKNVPMWYVSDDDAAGFDVELISIICTKLNYSYSFVSSYANTSALITAVQTGKIDGAAGSVSITEEREKVVDFTNPSYYGGAVLIYKKSESAIEGPDDLNGKNVGVLVGSVFESKIKEAGIVCSISNYNSISDCAEAVASGRIDAYIDDSPSALYTVSKKDDLAIAKEHLNADSMSYGFILNKNKGAALGNKLNEYIKAKTSDGTLDKLKKKWLSGTDEERTIKRSDFTFSGPSLTVSMVLTLPPFAYVGNDTEPYGYDVETIYGFCQEYGYTPSIKDVGFDALLAGISSNTFMVGAGSITYTEERAKSFFFTEPNYTGGFLAIVIASGSAPTDFWASLGDSFYSTFVKENRWKLFLEGYGITILITVASALLGTLLGGLLYLLLGNKRKWCRNIGGAYVRIMQGVPIVVILMVLFYLVFASLDMPSVLVAIIGFGISFAAEVGEILKSAVASVDKGEQEASLSMGFSRGQTALNVVIPQAIKNSIGVYMGSLSSMMKSTSIVGYIAIMDLTRASDIVRSRTFEAFFPLIVVSIVYFLTSWGFYALTKLLEKKLTPKKKDYSPLKEEAHE